MSLPHGPICKLRRSEPETLVHLGKDCTFTKEINLLHDLELVQLANLDQIRNIPVISSIYKLLEKKCRAKIDKTQKASVDRILINVWWNRFNGSISQCRPASTLLRFLKLVVVLNVLFFMCLAPILDHSSLVWIFCFGFRLCRQFWFGRMVVTWYYVVCLSSCFSFLSSK